MNVTDCLPSEHSQIENTDLMLTRRSTDLIFFQLLVFAAACVPGDSNFTLPSQTSTFRFPSPSGGIPDTRIHLHQLAMINAGFTLLLTVLVVLPVRGQGTSGLIEALDGTITISERREATDSLKEHGTASFFRRVGDFLLVAIESDSIGVASLCIGNQDEVNVLHASAALGALKFQPRDGLWYTADRFTWSLRDTSMSSKAQADRLSFLDRLGWVATTSAMGHPRQTEFVIRQSVLPDGKWFVGLGIMPSERPDEIIGLPASSAGDCASPDLVRGVDPTTGLTFNPTAWKEISGR